MSQNIRAVPGDSARHGRIWNVDGSGLASMSDSWTRVKPSIAEPSKPMPSANAPSSSAGATATDLRKPEHVGEPQPDESDVALLEGAEHELLLLVHAAHHARSRLRRDGGTRAASNPRYAF